MTMVWETVMLWTMDWTTADGVGRGGNRNMVTNADPLQKTLARIRVDSINPRHNVTMMVLFGWIYNNDAKYDAIKNGEKLGGGR